MDSIERFEVPGVEVFCLSDGGRDFAFEVFPDVSDDLRSARLSEAGLSGIATEFNAYVLRHADGAVDLVDAGYGEKLGTEGGGIARGLQALGIAPEAVRRILFTHLHGDHCSGALSGGQKVFPNAAIVLHRAERAFWAGRDDSGGHVLAAYGDNVTEVGDGDAIAPGVTVWALPGHTPGHMGLRFDGGLVLAADILHSAALQLPDPDVASIYDTDADQARVTRKAALAEIASKGLVWAGSHALPGAKFARLEVAGAGYRSVPL